MGRIAISPQPNMMRWQLGAYVPIASSRTDFIFKTVQKKHTQSETKQVKLHFLKLQFQRYIRLASRMSCVVPQHDAACEMK